MPTSPIRARLSERHDRGDSVVLSVNDEDAYVILNEDGSVTSLTEEAFLVAMGAPQPAWWSLVSGALVVSEHYPDVNKNLVLHYLSRPFGDRQILVRAAFENPTVVAPWLWLMFVSDPNRFVHQTTLKRLSEDTVWTPSLIDAVIVLLAKGAPQRFREKMSEAWDELPQRLQRHVMKPDDTSQEWASWRGRAPARSPLFNASPRSP